MPSESRGVTNGGSASATVTINNVIPPGPSSYLLLALAFSAIPTTVTSVTCGTGSFVRLAGLDSATKRIELWLGYGFGLSRPITATVVRTGGASTLFWARTIDVFTDGNVLPTFVASSSTGTGVTADPGLLTPSIGDLMFTGLVQASVATPSSRTNTGNTYLNSFSQGALATGQGCAWCEASAAVSTDSVWTLAASVDWAAIQVKITPPAPPAPTSALLLKGLTTQAADAASSY